MARNRKSGLSFVGEIAWGTHMCQFYETKQDLMDILVPYFVDGLKNNEFCVWVTSDFLTKQEAIAGMSKALPDFNDYLGKGQMEIFPYTEWYLKEGKFELQRVLNGWVEKHNKAIANRYAGMRVTGNPFWLSNKKEWDDFTQYEAEINNVIDNYKMLVLCTYSLNKCDANEIIDVIANHAFCIMKRSGKWTLVENSTQKKLNQAFRATQAKFHDLYSSMTEGVAFHNIIYDGKGQAIDYVITDVNPAFEQITAIPKEEAIGKKASVLYGTNNPPYLETYAKVASSGISNSFETYFPPMEKHFSISCISSEKGSFATVFHDITEHKKSLELLSYSRNRLELISSTASSLLSSEDPQSIIQEICNKVMAFLNFDVFFNFLVDEKQQRLHLNAYSGVPKESAQKFEWLNFGEAACGCAAQEGQRVICENILDTDDLKASLVRSFGVKAYAANPIFAQGKVIGTLSFGTKKKSIFNDDELSLMSTVTTLVSVAMQRKRVEKELWNAKNDWERTFNSVPDLIAILDSNHRIIRANKPMADQLGVTQEQAAGLPCYEAVHCTNAPPEICPHTETMLDGKEHIAEISEPRLGGDFIVSTSPLRDENGQIIGSIHVARNITERKKAETALKQRTEQLELAQNKLEEHAALIEEYATQMEELAKLRLEQLKNSERLAAIGATAGMVGHDIRNPLQSITGDLYIAKTELADVPACDQKESILECINEIEKSLEYINKIVQDLQDFARPLKPQLRECEVEDLIKEIIAKGNLPKNIQTKFSFDRTANMIMTDQTLLTRILVNLVNNAVQAMPDGGILSVHTKKAGENIQLTIEDTGVGIAEDTKPKLFTPLMTTKSKGQGFGLAVVKRMTETLGGTISFDSEVGKGTKFTVNLPIKPQLT